MKVRSRYLAALSAVLLGAVAWLAWQQADHRSAGVARLPGSTPAGQRGVYYGPPRSLAVLPFRAARSDEDQQAQAFGFAAELIDTLIGRQALRVTASNSSFFFRDPGADRQVIGERLQSAWLLDGDWDNRSGQVRVQARLFNSRDGHETWHQAYDSSLKDVWELRDRIVADVLAQVHATGTAKPTQRAGPDPLAWLDYVRGRYAADPLGRQDLQGAQAAYRAALERQADYADARLAAAGLWLQTARQLPDTADALERARDAAQQVLQDDPDSATALILLSQIRYHHDWDWLGAEQAAQRAVRLRPGDSAALRAASQALATLGRLELAETRLQAAIERDPLNLGSRLRLGLLQEFRGEYDTALATYRQVLALNSDAPGAHAYRARVKVLQGKASSALNESEQEGDPFWQRYARTLAMLAAEESSGETGESRALLQQMIDENAASAAFQIAEMEAFSGDSDAAFHWLGRAREQRDPGIGALLGNPFLRNLRNDPRWSVLLSDLGLPLDSPAESDNFN